MNGYSLLVALGVLAATLAQQFGGFGQNNQQFGNNQMMNKPPQFRQLGPGPQFPGGPVAVGPHPGGMGPHGPQQPNVDVNKFLHKHGINLGGRHSHRHGKMGRRGHGRRGHKGRHHHRG